MPEKILVGGEWRETSEVLTVNFPYDGSVAGEVYMASQQDMEDAIVAAEKGFQITRKLPSHKRSEILENLGRIMRERFDDFVNAMILEGGKTRKIAIGEMTRALQTIKISGEEARRIGGEVFSVDWMPAGENRQGFTKRLPIGIILGITPFNYPINLAAHKIGPAIASGNAMILKPAEKTPLSSVLLAQAVLDAGYPPEAFSMLNAWGKDTSYMVEDDRIAMLSFTGSGPIGWMLKSKAGRKKVALELGGNAGVVVHNDANLEMAAAQSAAGGFANAGQNCISVQRILVHQDVFDEFANLFVSKVQALKLGDPRAADTDIGPMITLNEAERAATWVQDAVNAGATVLHGGKHDGRMFEPTVLGQTVEEMMVNCQEVFAPIVTLRPYENWDDALAIVNDTPFGLQAGIFTNDMKRIMHAWENVDVGGLQVNSVPTFRVDHMPYGGVKMSGFGREGVKYAIEEMTDIHLMVLNLN